MDPKQAALCYMDEHGQQAYDLLIELAQIPAPTNQEEQRAQFCRSWLEQQGCGGVCVDEALNVVFPVGDTGSNELVVYMAHSDVVFPDTEPLPLRVKGGKAHTRGEYVLIDSLLPGLKTAAEMILHHF